MNNTTLLRIMFNYFNLPTTQPSEHSSNYIFHFISFIQHSIDPYMVSPSDIELVIQKEIIIKSRNER